MSFDSVINFFQTSRQTAKKLHTMLEGSGRLFDFSSSYNQLFYAKWINLHSENHDFESIKSDWDIIGNDLSFHTVKYIVSEGKADTEHPMLNTKNFKLFLKKMQEETDDEKLKEEIEKYSKRLHAAVISVTGNNANAE